MSMMTVLDSIMMEFQIATIENVKYEVRFR